MDSKELALTILNIGEGGYKNDYYGFKRLKKATDLIDKHVKEQLIIAGVVGRSEQLKASFQIGEKVLLDDHTEVEVIVAEPKLYIRQNEFDSEMWVNIERLKKKSL